MNITTPANRGLQEFLLFTGLRNLNLLSGKILVWGTSARFLQVTGAAAVPVGAIV